MYENPLLYIVMDRSWINDSLIGDVYEKGFEEFTQFFERNGAGIYERYYCPCVNCLNGKRLDIELIQEHALCDDFLKSYTTWTWHGEVLNLPYISETECQHSNIHSKDCMKDMISYIREDSFHQTRVWFVERWFSNRFVFRLFKFYTFVSCIIII